MEIEIPAEVPVMTLPNTVFFPQVLLPLHIFESRYRKMLKDVLASHRVFAVAHLNQSLAASPDQFEPPHPIATVGIIRACQKNDNGTSNLLLQGLVRVEVLEILREEPYRAILVRPIPSLPGGSPDDLATLHTELIRLVALKQKLGASVPVELADFLRGVIDPDTLVNVAAFNLCEDAALKQKLLEIPDTLQRFKLFNLTLYKEIEALKLRRKLQGHLSDDAISNN
ncbi:MAG TPA: LON peptidase substrate-binding domain-containing protein [Opitutaceae bacterium]|nr:LON peptidase substrate-binding domain-containing protein [Opitutaceae bacterium]